MDYDASNDFELALVIADVGSAIRDHHLCRYQNAWDSCWGHEHHDDQIHSGAKRSGHHAYLHV